MVSSLTISASEACNRSWDVIVIGTGMAGATLGHALARGGKQVLFCEKGRSLLPTAPALRGDLAETFFDRPTAPSPEQRETLRRAGRYADPITDVSGPHPSHDIPFIGCGTGGSSALYGAALERFFRADFTPRQNHPQAADSTLPEAWPVSYDEMAPFYERAEQLYRLRGSADPLRPDGGARLRPPPPLCAAGQKLQQRFADQGLHPYRLPQACEFVPGCHGCQGFLCPNNCKNDSARICLTPALEKHGARLLDECEVVRLEADAETVTGVVCRHRAQELVLRGTTIVLAAGALETPGILLRSTSPDWPAGLANRSGMVGRNLMRHYIDLYALAPGTRHGYPGNLKELAFNDFYQLQGEKFGTVQSFGSLPPAAVILAELGRDLERGRRPWLVPFFRLGRPLLGKALTGLLARRVLFASIMEDLPYADNRVTLADDPARLAIHYRIAAHERERIRRFRRMLGEAFRPYRFIRIKQAENNLRLAHVCGTCRFGADPAQSVLDRNNRAHDLANLYVVDASFFPSSSGTNPALTLAANALRVAAHLLQEPVTGTGHHD